MSEEFNCPCCGSEDLDKCGCYIYMKERLESDATGSREIEFCDTHKKEIE